MSRQEQSHSDGPENNSCQKIEITGSKKMPYNHDYSEDVERRSDTMKHPINWVHMSTFDCLNNTKRHCSLINLIAMGYFNVTIPTVNAIDGKDIVKRNP